MALRNIYYINLKGGKKIYEFLRDKYFGAMDIPLFQIYNNQ